VDAYTPVKQDDESNAYAISEGKRLYQAFNCVGCHAHGGGGIGPPLMDATWIHESGPQDIFATIVDGDPNGMPAFGGKIPDSEVWQIVAYVRSLSGLSASTDAAPGRDDHMKGPPPPNSVNKARTRVSSTELEETRRREDAEFDALGWRDRRSEVVRVPRSVVRETGQEEARRSATRPATRPTTQAWSTLKPG
jgi:cytochrome c5